MARARAARGEPARQACGARSWPHEGPLWQPTPSWWWSSDRGGLRCGRPQGVRVGRGCQERAVCSRAAARVTWDRVRCKGAMRGESEVRPLRSAPLRALAAAPGTASRTGPMPGNLRLASTLKWREQLQGNPDYPASRPAAPFDLREPRRSQRLHPRFRGPPTGEARLPGSRTHSSSRGQPPPIRGCRPPPEVRLHVSNPCALGPRTRPLGTPPSGR